MGELRNYGAGSIKMDGLLFCMSRIFFSVLCHEMKESVALVNVSGNEQENLRSPAIIEAQTGR